MRGYGFATKLPISLLRLPEWCVAIPLRGYGFATRPTGYSGRCLRRCCNPLAGLWFCDKKMVVEIVLSSGGCNPLAGLWFCDVTLNSDNVAVLRLQSTCGAMVLRQHTPLIAVLDSASKGGFYENRQLSTGCLWITAQKRVFFAMSAYKSPPLDFFVQGLAIFIARTLCQVTLSEPPTRAVYHFAQNRMCGLHNLALRRLERGFIGLF